MNTIAIIHLKIIKKVNVKNIDIVMKKELMVLMDHMEIIKKIYNHIKLIYKNTKNNSPKMKFQEDIKISNLILKR